MASTIRGNDNFDSSGPFGASTLISDAVSVGTGTVFSVSFSGNYRSYRLILNGIYTGSNFPYLAWRYTDGSGNNITSQAYAFQYAMKNTTLRYNLDNQMYIPEYFKENAAHERAYIDMEIYNPNSATEVTTQRGFFHFSLNAYYSGTFTSQVAAHTYGISANNSIYFYTTGGYNFSAGTYSLWGLN